MPFTGSTSNISSLFPLILNRYQDQIPVADDGRLQLSALISDLGGIEQIKGVTLSFEQVCCALMTSKVSEVKYGRLALVLLAPSVVVENDTQVQKNVPAKLLSGAFTGLKVIQDEFNAREFFSQFMAYAKLNSEQGQWFSASEILEILSGLTNLSNYQEVDAIFTMLSEHVNKLPSRLPNHLGKSAQSFVNEMLTFLCPYLVKETATAQSLMLAVCAKFISKANIGISQNREIKNLSCEIAGLRYISTQDEEHIQVFLTQFVDNLQQLSVQRPIFVASQILDILFYMISLSGHVATKDILTALTKCIGYIVSDTQDSTEQLIKTVIAYLRPYLMQETIAPVAQDLIIKIYSKLTTPVISEAEIVSSSEETDEIEEVPPPLAKRRKLVETHSNAVLE